MNDKKCNPYPTVVINGQTWMQKNMDYLDSEDETFSYDYPDGNSGNRTNYGLLYDWNTANNICPAGWHLPTKTEFENLKAYLDSVGENFNGNNFKALAAGYYASPGKGVIKPGYYAFGTSAAFWSSTPNGSSSIQSHVMLINNYLNTTGDSQILISYNYINLYYSVRCVQD